MNLDFMEVAVLRNYKAVLGTRGYTRSYDSKVSQFRLITVTSDQYLCFGPTDMP